MRRISAELVHRLTDLRPGHDLAPVGLGVMARYALTGGTVVALDEQLRAVRRRDVDVPGGGKLLAATPDLSSVVLGARDHLVVHGDRTVEIGIEAADAAVFVGGDRLVVTAPVVERRDHDGRPYESKGEHLVHLVEARTGTVVDRAELDVIDAGVFAVPHPHDGSILLDAGLGQDGSATFVTRVLGDRLAVKPMREDVSVSGFDPSGGRLLLTPHPGFGDVATVVDWPALRPLAQLSGAGLAFDDGGLDLYGCFLSDDRIVLQAGEYEDYGVLVCSADLTPVAWLDLGHAPGESEVSSVWGVGPDLIAVEVWADGEATAAVWRVPAS
ncbi:hypothetical protein [Paractinoplanes maris]|uniref:hypothetical protein n=1 Tax=Paractinoplanes maris TaxID=1734446 RepID=UPI002022774C|nr:hypothetical protein [Actinoplanes maris]